MTCVSQPDFAAVLSDRDSDAADDSRDYIMSPSSGILEPLVELGDEVDSGQPVAQLHSLEHPDRTPEPVLAANRGILVSRRSIPLTAQGECISNPGSASTDAEDIHGATVTTQCRATATSGPLPLPSTPRSTRTVQAMPILH